MKTISINQSEREGLSVEAKGTNAIADELRRYAEVVYDPADIIEMRTLPLGHQRWCKASELVGLLPDITLKNNAHHKQNAYVGANPRKSSGGSKNEDVSLFRCVFSDFDNTSQAEVERRLAASFLPKPAILINSGHGAHVYWRLDEPMQDAIAWTRVQKGLAKLLNSDPKICDPARIMRLPGTTNWKDQKSPVACTIVRGNTFTRCSLAEIEKCLPRDEQASATTPLVNAPANANQTGKARAYLSKLPPAISGKHGHDQLFRAACILVHGFDLKPNEALPLIMEYNRRCQPTFDLRDAEHKLADAEKREDNYGRPRGFMLTDSQSAEKEDSAKSFTQLAESFRDSYGNVLRYFQNNFHTHSHEENKYAILPDDRLGADLRRFGEAHGLDMTIQRKKELRDALADLTRASDEEINRGNQCIHFSNGSLLRDSLKSVDKPVLLSPDPRRFNVNSSPHPFDAGATCPRWERFLNETLGANAAMTGTIQQMAGYLLSGDTSLQKLFVIFGGPGKGKGTLIRALTAMLGAFNTCNPTLTALAGGFGPSALLNKMVAFLGDAHLGKSADSTVAMELLKAGSGEDALDIPRKHKDTLTGVRLPTRFVLVCNELPRFPDSASALARRVVVVEMNQWLGEPEGGLEGVLVSEMSGITAWAISGYRKLLAKGAFTIPESSASLMEEWGEANAPIKAFINARCRFGAAHQIDSADLYAAWREWCRLNRHEEGSPQSFGMKLRAAVPAAQRHRRSAGDRQWYYMGLTLNERT